MIKLIINSEYFKWYRKKKLEKIYNYIVTGKKDYCCHVNIGLFICWKNFKEVKENMNSKYLYNHIRYYPKSQDCRRCWFITRYDRIDFLKECLTKF